MCIANLCIANLLNNLLNKAQHRIEMYANIHTEP